MLPKYPIYVISKGRWESRLTAKSLEEINCPYRIVIEPQEFKEYSKSFKYGRWQHQVNYKPFANNKLLKRN